MPTPGAINVTHCLLTYPQADLDKQELAQFLFDKEQVKAVKVCKETHQDGSPHLHAYVVFHKRTKFNPGTFFDFQGKHANVKTIKQRVGYADKVIEYLDKEDDAPITLPEGYSFSVQRKRTFNDVAGDALEAESREEAINIIKSQNPDKWLLYSDAIERTLDKQFKRPRKIYTPPFPLESFRIPAAITNWKLGNLDHPRPIRPKCLILVGDTRLGKTHLARAFGDHVYVSGMWGMDDFMGWDWSGYVVFNDVPWDSFKYSYKQWMGAQRDFISTDKYCKKCKMEGGVPLILCCNEDDYETYQANWNKSWVFGNSIVVTIGEKLY